MSTSGSIGGTNAALLGAKAQQVAVRLLNVPDGLQSNRQTLRIEGTITGQGANKTFLVLTAYGELTVQAKGGMRAREGQNIQIDVPPGNTPKDSVLRPSPQRADAAQIVPKEAPSLLKAVADKLVSLSRKADLSQSIVTEAQKNIATTGKESLIKTASLAADTAIRLAPMNLKGQADSALSLVKTQLNIAGVQSSMMVPSMTGSIFVPMSAIQGQPIQTIPLSNTALFQSVVGSDAGQWMTRNTSNSMALQPMTGSAGSIHSGQPVTFPFASNGQIASFDGRVLQGFSNNIQSTPFLNHFTSLSSGALGGMQQGQFLLNGQAGAVSFQVVGHTATQQPVVSPIYATMSGQTPNPMPSFSLQFPTNSLNAGSVITLQPLGWSQFTGRSLAVPIDPFSSLAQSMKELQAVNPALSQALSVLTPSVAQPAQKAGSAMLFLFSALQGGSLQGWVGNGADKLSAQHKVLQALEQSLKDAVSPKLVQNTPTGDWRAYNIPMQTQESAVPISLYVQDNPAHKENETEEHDKKNAVTRFVFEFDLTRMGEIQIDGLMRERNVDIFIRTRQELGPEMKRMVRSVYLDALDQSNLTGDVAFQFDPKKWIHVCSPK
jgi:hypothetical protein